MMKYFAADMNMDQTTMTKLNILKSAVADFITAYAYNKLNKDIREIEKKQTYISHMLLKQSNSPTNKLNNTRERKKS